MKNLLFIAAFLCSTIAMAQTDKKGFASFNLGVSMPTGDFASDDVEDEDAGLAKSGLMFDIDLGYKLSDNIGIMAKFRRQSNPVDTDQMEDELNDPGINTNIDSKNWTTTGGYAGLFVALPVGETVSFELRGLVGFASSASPLIEISMSDGSYRLNMEQSSETATSLGLIIGGGFKFMLSESIALNLNADYFSTNTEFEDIEIEVSDSDGNFDSGQMGDWEMSIQTINLSAGISLLF